MWFAGDSAWPWAHLTPAGQPCATLVYVAFLTSNTFNVSRRKKEFGDDASRAEDVTVSHGWRGRSGLSGSRSQSSSFHGGCYF